MPFQNKVNIVQAPAVEGDFASANPRASVLAGPGGLVAGPGGVTVGRFAWVGLDGKSTTSYATAQTAPDGFVHRDQQALIGVYLQEFSMNVPEGFGVTLHDEGDFWVKNAGPGASAKDTPIYAGYADGKAYMGSAPAGASATGSIGSTNTAAIGSTFTATATGTSLAVTSVTGKLSVGDTISGAGIPAGTTITAGPGGGGAGTYTTSVVTTATAATVTSFGTVLVVSATTGLISVGDTVAGGAGFPTGATIVSQLAGGTPGGAGSYVLSAPATAYVASATGVTTYGIVLDVTAVASGTLLIGDSITGTGVPAGASIASQISGTSGAVGIYTIDVAATAYAASTTVTAAGGVLTNFVAKSVAAVGELVKISTWGN